MAQNNLTLAKEVLNAIGTFDIKKLGFLMADDAHYWVAGMPRDQLIPRDALLGAMSQMGTAVFDGPLEFTVHDTTVEGDRVALEVTSKARLKNGQGYANVYHFLFVFRDGKLILGREYADTQLLAQLPQPQ